MFSGGFTVEAVVQVCADERIPASAVLRLLGGLVDKSVLIRDEVDGVTRLRMLYTIRQYGLQLLAESGDERRIRGRHLDYMLQLAERCAGEWLGPNQVELAAVTRREHNNLRSALDFALGDPQRRIVGARLATALQFYWLDCGFIGEGRRWLDRVLELDDLPVHTRQNALWINSYAATALGELPTGRRLGEQAVAIARDTGDPLMMANALLAYGGSAFVGGELERGQEVYHQCVDHYAKAGVIDCQAILAHAALGMSAAFAGNHDRAVAAAEKAIELADAHGERWTRSYAHYAVAVATWKMGRTAEAARHAMTGIRIKDQFNDLLGLSLLVELMAWIAGSAGAMPQAAEVLGIASSLWRHTGGEVFLASDNWALPHRAASRRRERRWATSGTSRSTPGARRAPPPSMTPWCRRSGSRRTWPPPRGRADGVDQPGDRGRRAGRRRRVQQGDRRPAGDLHPDRRETPGQHPQEARLHLPGAARGLGRRPPRCAEPPAWEHAVSSQLTTFVGRDTELAEARRLLATARLLTLVGPAGVGKTRIAQRIARESAPDFADGVVVIELDALSDPDLLPAGRGGRARPA
ncbi:hypothetical protein [Kutzneria kofuensis]|uniref:hypothetical protein n=1 Tax=Kutzneria kofuensis TaxID=103725 RepID=UPI00337C46E7